MRLVVSGYAGVGKSTILEKVKKDYEGVFVFPESAREVDLAKDFYNISDDKGEFFQKSILDNEIMKILLSFENNVKKAVFDRSIIDNLAFAAVYYGDLNINKKAIQKFIDDLRFKENVDYIYDKKIFIYATTDKEFIKNEILNDPLRLKTTSTEVDSFINRANDWNHKFFDLYNDFEGISKNFIEIEHFQHNKDFNNEIDLILNKSFL